MAHGVYDYDENGDLKTPAWFGRNNLALLLVFAFLSSVAAAMRLTLSNYNRHEHKNWIIAGAITDQSVTFHIRMNQHYGQRFFVSTEPISEYEPKKRKIVKEEWEMTEEERNQTLYGKNEDEDESKYYLIDLTLESLSTQPDPTMVVVLEDLDPSRAYYYGRIKPNHEMLYTGYVVTAPQPHKRANFKFVAGGSAFTGSNHDIFRQMANENALFWLHLGNLHYGSNAYVDDVDDRFIPLDQTMTSANQAALFSRIALSYMWHDQDYLGKTMAGSTLGRTDALDTFQYVFPVYERKADAKNKPPKLLPNEESVLLWEEETDISIPLETELENAQTVQEEEAQIVQEEDDEAPFAPYHAFTIGTVRFIMSDLSSEFTEDFIMSQKQKVWLQQEFLNAERYDFVIWVTPSTWMGEDDKGERRHEWIGRQDDRKEISEFISANVKSQNILALSAGTEMFAYDDGSHTYYGGSVNETAYSFPLLLSGPMDRLGRFVDAPYSDGCSVWLYERNHIYSTVEFIGGDTAGGQSDNATEPCLQIHSYRVTGVDQQEILLSKRLCGKIFMPQETSSSVPATGILVGSDDEVKCEEEYFSPIVYTLVTYAFGLMCADIVMGFLVGAGLSEAILMGLLTAAGVVVNIGAMVMLPSLSRGIHQFESFFIAAILLAQLGFTALFFVCWARFYYISRPCDQRRRNRIEAQKMEKKEAEKVAQAKREQEEEQRRLLEEAKNENTDLETGDDNEKKKEKVGNGSGQVEQAPRKSPNDRHGRPPRPDGEEIADESSLRSSLKKDGSIRSILRDPKRNETHVTRNRDQSIMSRQSHQSSLRGRTIGISRDMPSISRVSFKEDFNLDSSIDDEEEDEETEVEISFMEVNKEETKQVFEPSEEPVEQRHDKRSYRTPMDQPVERRRVPMDP